MQRCYKSKYGQRRKPLGQVLQAFVGYFGGNFVVRTSFPSMLQIFPGNEKKKLTKNPNVCQIKKQKTARNHKKNAFLSTPPPTSPTNHGSRLHTEGGEGLLPHAVRHHEMDVATCDNPRTKCLQAEGMPRGRGPRRLSFKMQERTILAAMDHGPRGMFGTFCLHTSERERE